MTCTNIYLAGVGGQGIGLLSDILCHALGESTGQVMACDTHGVAQRGGIVVSQIRAGEGIYSPGIGPHQAHVVVALERMEAYRATVNMLAPNGTLIYYDAVVQPLAIRVSGTPYPSHGQIAEQVKELRGCCHRVNLKGLANSKLHNMALLGKIAGLDLIDGISVQQVRKWLQALVPKSLVEDNLAVFDRVSNNRSG